MPHSRRVRLLVAWCLLTACAVGRAAYRGWRQSAGADAAPIAAPVRIDPARAPVAELMALPGIGRKRAEAIVLERVRHGPFTGPDDLLRVAGIGPHTSAELRPWLAQPPSAARQSR